MELIFERSRAGHRMALLPACDVPETAPDFPLREKAPRLPEVSEVEMSRHYSVLEQNAFGVNDGFYPSAHAP